MIFCYRTGDGELVEQIFRIGKAPKTIHLADGRIARRSLADERKSLAVGSDAPSRHSKKTWPMECFASGVHPEQADELRTHLKRSGVPTEVSPDGNPIYRSARHRRKALKARGMVDRSSFC